VKEKIGLKDLTLRTSFVIGRENEIMQAQMRRNRVEVIFGEASFADSHALAVRGRDETSRYTAESKRFRTISGRAGRRSGWERR